MATRCLGCTNCTMVCPTGAARIGTVQQIGGDCVEMRTLLGGRRIIDLPSGAGLPRIC